MLVYVESLLGDVWRGESCGKWELRSGEIDRRELSNDGLPGSPPVDGVRPGDRDVLSNVSFPCSGFEGLRAGDRETLSNESELFAALCGDVRASAERSYSS